MIFYVNFQRTSIAVLLKLLLQEVEHQQIVISHLPGKAEHSTNAHILTRTTTKLGAKPSLEKMEIVNQNAQELDSNTSSEICQELLLKRKINNFVPDLKINIKKSLDLLIKVFILTHILLIMRVTM